MLIAIPLGATISLQVGQLTRQLGAESLTGAVVIVGVIREAAPIAAALLIAGAGGSALTAAMGARHIRAELSPMEVMAVHPTHRLLTPPPGARPEERRVGPECVRKCSPRWGPCH